MPALLPILGLIFITLKLMGYIAWSWWLVLLPLYGSAILGLVIFLVVALAFGGIAASTKRSRTWR
jgi:hypothetical protein